jgi:hypothetical protein
MDEILIRNNNRDISSGSKSTVRGLFLQVSGRTLRSSQKIKIMHFSRVAARGSPCAQKRFLRRMIRTRHLARAHPHLLDLPDSVWSVRCVRRRKTAQTWCVCNHLEPFQYSPFRTEIGDFNVRMRWQLSHGRKCAFLKPPVVPKAQIVQWL